MNKDNLRNTFYNLDNITHLAACSKSPMLKSVKEAIECYMDDVIKLGNPWEMWTGKVEEARSLFARIINADSKDVAVLYSVSSALNAILSSMDFAGRKNIVTSDMEFPNTNFALNGYARYGAEIRTVKGKNNIIDIEDYGQTIDKNTIMTTAIHVSSLNGFRQDVDEIARIAHENGSYIYVDDYQSLGGVNMDVKKSGIDFIASGNLKWLLGVSGIAFLYVDPKISKLLKPANIGWFSQKNPFEFGSQSLDYAEGAKRFENGTWSMPSVYASIEGMKTILDNYGYIEGEDRKLFHHALEVLEEKKIKTITPEQAANIIAIPMKDPAVAERVLKEKYGIITSAREDSLRIAPHFYNNFKEIEDAVDKIKIEFFK
jgi:selenocysteine lyase/cysteine desulfurase